MRGGSGVSPADPADPADLAGDGRVPSPHQTQSQELQEFGCARFPSFVAGHGRLCRRSATGQAVEDDGGHGTASAPVRCFATGGIMSAYTRT
jgi:hypothetical protein